MSGREFKGKVALITGSTSGIGLGIARSLAAQGASIVLNGLISATEAEQIRSTLASEFRVPVGFHPANLAEASQIDEMIAYTIESQGSVDILINNAGIQHVAPIEEFPDDKWDAILAVNLSSVFHAIKKSLPHMKAKSWGRIINIASTHGLVASAQKSAYVAAKHGVIGLTKVVALETAKTPITCNAICPGWVLTPLVQKQIDDIALQRKISQEEARRQLLAEKQPSLEFATPEQIGAAVVFLCTEGAAQIRGVSLNIDGGWLAQ